MHEDTVKSHVIDGEQIEMHECRFFLEHNRRCNYRIVFINDELPLVSLYVID